MDESVWINGEIMRLSDARIGIEDRGFQFADGVYEVMRLYYGRPFALEMHLDRLERSSRGIQLAPPERATVRGAIDSVLSHAGLTDGMVYLQATRGEALRNHVFPPGLVKKGGQTFAGTLLCYARGLDRVGKPGTGRGIKLVTVPDERWKRCWVKSIALLANVLAKNQAVSQGADEAVFVNEGTVSECSTSNLFAVIDGTLITHPVGPSVLPGITRAILLEIAPSVGIAVQERPLLEREAGTADELFISSTTREINWVASWNGQPVADTCGPIALRLHREFQQRVRREITANA